MGLCFLFLFLKKKSFVCLCVVLDVFMFFSWFSRVSGFCVFCVVVVVVFDTC